jgi:hypothetical protein
VEQQSIVEKEDRDGGKHRMATVSGVSASGSAFI